MLVSQTSLCSLIQVAGLFVMNLIRRLSERDPMGSSGQLNSNIHLCIKAWYILYICKTQLYELIYCGVAINLHKGPKYSIRSRAHLRHGLKGPVGGECHDRWFGCKEAFIPIESKDKYKKPILKSHKRPPLYRVERIKIVYVHTYTYLTAMVYTRKLHPRLNISYVSVTKYLV